MFRTLRRTLLPLSRWSRTFAIARHLPTLIGHVSLPSCHCTRTRRCYRGLAFQFTPSLNAKVCLSSSLSPQLTRPSYTLAWTRLPASRRSSQTNTSISTISANVVLVARSMRWAAVRLVDCYIPSLSLLPNHTFLQWNVYRVTQKSKLYIHSGGYFNKQSKTICRKNNKNNK